MFYSLLRNIVILRRTIFTREIFKEYLMIILQIFSSFPYKTYRSWPNYHTYPYKRTYAVKKFRSLQITASALFVYFFM